VEGLRSFLGALGDNDFGLLLSTGGFTREAREELGKTEYQRVNGMDLVKFYDLWIKHYDKLSREAHDLFPIKKKVIHFLSPHA
jgi:restriction system protein